MVLRPAEMGESNLSPGVSTNRRALGFPPSSASLIAIAIAIAIVIAHHHIPPVEAICAPVGENVAGFDLAVLWKERDQRRWPAALHAHDLHWWRHPTVTGVSEDLAGSSAPRPVRNISTPMIPARIDPANIPTLASSAMI